MAKFHKSYYVGLIASNATFRPTNAHFGIIVSNVQFGAKGARPTIRTERLSTDNPRQTPILCQFRHDGMNRALTGRIHYLVWLVANGHDADKPDSYGTPGQARANPLRSGNRDNRDLADKGDKTDTGGAWHDRSAPVRSECSHANIVVNGQSRTRGIKKSGRNRTTRTRPEYRRVEVAKVRFVYPGGVSNRTSRVGQVVLESVMSDN